MRCKSVFDNALRLIGAGSSPDLTDDYLSRMPFLLACFVGECYAMDTSYRQRLIANGADLLPDTFDRTTLDADEEFPLSVRFAPAAAYYLASLLTVAENPSLADRLYERYCDAMSHIRAGIPMVIGEIGNKYPA